MARCSYFIALCVAIALFSCSSPTRAQKRADGKQSTLKARVPAADPNKYRSVRDARDWQNPYLVVHANGVDARPISSTTGAESLSPSEVLTYLEKLPSVVWPYGLVVAVQESGLRAQGEDAQIKRKREELQRVLTEAGVKVELWPSA